MKIRKLTPEMSFQENHSSEVATLWGVEGVQPHSGPATSGDFLKK